MTPIHKLLTYLIRLDESVHIVEGYINSQLDLLHTYPYDGYQLPLAGGVFGRNNTDIVQVYVSDYVKYIL